MGILWVHGTRRLTSSVHKACILDKTNRLFLAALSILVTMLILTMVWHARLSDSLEKTNEELARMEAKLNKMDTRARVLPTRGVQVEKKKRKKSVSELHRPRGPMPVSLIVKSDERPGELPAGSDVTSRIKRRQIDPCEAPCVRLGECSLNRKLCPGLDTRRHDKAVDACRRACGASKAVAHDIIGATECREAIAMASRQVAGFAVLCTGDK